MIECGRLFRINPKTGRIYWLDVSKFHSRLNGSEAGCPRPSRSGKAYWIVKVGGKPYRRSHIIFAITRDRWPSQQIDHINGDSLDDRPGNLREATQTQNAWNHKRRAKRSTLPMGVRALGGRFQARIAVNRQTLYLGVFDTPQQAKQEFA